MLLSTIVFLPVAGAILLAIMPGGRPAAIRWTAAIVTIVTFVLSMILFQSFDFNTLQPQFVVKTPWIPALNIQYYLGVDGISLPMVVLTTLLGFLAILVSWHIERRVKEYFIWLLVLETGVLGVFTALDFFLFFLFWEVELLPMFFLISIWGTPPPLGRREYSAWKFLIYTIFGSAFMLVGILLLYFSAGTFDIIQLGSMNVTQTLVPVQLIFWLIFFAFAVKLPMFPLHTWLPDAHTDAPTAVSVILAGVLLKMGGYGIIRTCVTIFPEVAQQYAPILATLAVVNVLYGALVTIRQTDMKRLIAYSSVSHMGFVLLGIAALTPVGLSGAVLQMFTHGTITGLLFALVGLVYDKTHLRDVTRLRGLAHHMPFIAVCFVIAGLASLGLPGMSGFVSELLVFLGAFEVNAVAAILSTLGILLTAGYILWMLERVFFRERDDHYAGVGDATFVEKVPLIVLIAITFLIGVQPWLLTDIIEAGIRPVLERLG